MTYNDWTSETLLLGLYLEKTTLRPNCIYVNNKKTLSDVLHLIPLSYLAFLETM